MVLFLKKDLGIQRCDFKQILTAATRPVNSIWVFLKMSCKPLPSQRWKKALYCFLVLKDACVIGWALFTRFDSAASGHGIAKIRKRCHRAMQGSCCYWYWESVHTALPYRTPSRTSIQKMLRFDNNFIACSDMCDISYLVVFEWLLTPKAEASVHSSRALPYMATLSSNGRVDFRRHEM